MCKFVVNSYKLGKKFVSLQLLLACRAVMSSEDDGASGQSTTY